jgi:hypothetical protein|tara:strand:- start:578 stop:865 length:288 start_codon:yes stop_codon:yes gene_type:complete
MNLESKKIVKELTNKLLTQTLLTQTIIDLLLDKGFCTPEEFDDRLKDSIEAMEDIVIENSDFMQDINSFLEDTPDEELGEESVMKGMFYGPMGEA